MTDDRGRTIGGIEVITDLTGVVRLEEQVRRLSAETAELVGDHPSMARLREVVRVAAGSGTPVLITGETGTGKELVARAVHRASDRGAQPFLRVSCAQPEDPLTRELFGCTRGVHAEYGRTGLFEAARGGTLFLDEIGHAPRGVWVKLLRVLEEGVVTREGESGARRIDVRVLAASSQDLLALAQRGEFLPELYYRLAVIPVHVPPLRERLSDLPQLVEHFVKRTNHALAGFTPGAMARFAEYGWPGNVRELENAVEYAASLCASDRIDERALPPSIVARAAPPSVHGGPHRHPGDEKVLEALRAAGGNRTEAARTLGVSRVTLWKWIRRLGIEND